MFKKLLTLFLALTLLLSGIWTAISFGIQSDEPGAYPPEFVNATIAITQENWQDNYFSSVTMTLGEDLLMIDGQRVRAESAEIEAGELILPIADIARVIGVENYIGESAGDPAGMGNSKTAGAGGQAAQKRGRGFATKEETERALNVRVQKKGNQITITKPYQTKALIVQTNNKTRLKDTYGASQAVDNGSGLHLLQYLSEEGAQRAHALLERSSNVKYVEPNAIVSLCEAAMDGEAAAAGEAAVADDAATAGDTYVADDAATAGDTSVAGDAATAGDASTADDATAAGDAGIEAEADIELEATAAQFKSVLSARWGAERIAADRFMQYLEETGKTSDELIVAVVDTGVDATHPFFQGRVRTDLGYNFVLGNTNTADEHWHGTHVAGTIADCTPMNVKIIPIKVLNKRGHGTVLNIALGIRRSAENGAKIINMSLGGRENSETYIQREAVNYAEALGALCVVAAGNNGDGYADMAPANFKNVLTVAAIDLDDTLAGFSNFGLGFIDIAAPGVEIFSCTTGSGYDCSNGTSMATPHAAAAAAMLKLNNPSLSPSQLISAVKSCAVSKNPTYFGAGILDLNLFFGAAIPEAPGFQLTRHVIHAETMAGNYKTYQMQARFTPVTTSDKRVTYTIDNPNVATCTPSGLVEIKGYGMATITATAVSGGYTDTCLVNATLDDSKFWFGSASKSFAGGNGNIDNPYKIATAAQLALLA